MVNNDTTAPVEGYLITYLPRDGGRTDIFNAAASVTSVVLTGEDMTGLEMGTSYTVTVVGLNSTGNGMPASKDA